MNDPYDIWRHERAGAAVPDRFSDRVMDDVRKQSHSRWLSGIAVAAAVAIAFGMAAAHGAVVATVVLAAPAAAD
jgi:hypothetical protein